MKRIVDCMMLTPLCVCTLAAQSHHVQSTDEKNMKKKNDREHENKNLIEYLQAIFIENSTYSTLSLNTFFMQKDENFFQSANIENISKDPRFEKIKSLIVLRISRNVYTAFGSTLTQIFVRSLPESISSYLDIDFIAELFRE